jgi:hypothetical protein
VRRLQPFAALALLVSWLGACADDQAAQVAPDATTDSASGADATVDSGPPPGTCGRDLGASCFEDEQCESGICFISEYAPFGVCTVPCLEAPGFCETEPGVFVDGAWCVAFPETDFRTFNHPELSQFCVRTCDELSDCATVEPAYEECGDLTYKGNPLFPSDPKKVCQAPSATGQEPVDPFTCEGWDTKNPGEENAKALCRGYCDYLDVCQIYEPGHNLECCAWYCFNRLAGSAFSKSEKETYKDVLTNYVNTFKSRQGSAIQCTQPVQQFGPPGQPDANAPAPVSGKCR